MATRNDFVLGVLPLLSCALLVSCSNRGGPDGRAAQVVGELRADGGTSSGPDELELAEARCRWPCDETGCIKPLTGERCLLRCDADSDCPRGSVCICEEASCSLGLHNVLGDSAELRSNSCFKLLPRMEQLLKECRSGDAGCSKHP